MAVSSRQTAYQALMRVEEELSYSNIILNSVLRNEMSERDKRFVSALFYGVIEKKLLLDYNLSQFSDRPVNTLAKEVLMILRMGLYQLFFMNGVPASAAVNESVRLCKGNQLYSTAPFVNAVLRAASKAENIRLPDKRKGKNKYLSIKYSCPEAIIRLWRQSYGDELTEGMLSVLDGRPPITARVNTLKITPCALAERLTKSGVCASISAILENSIELKDTGSVEELDEYKEGLFHIQDTASQLCCELLEAQKGQTVTDACSAPGGKAFTIAEIMDNTGKIIACDLYRHRLALVEKGADRLGINIISVMQANSAERQELPQADRILCDVPCSGLGIIRRKPELRYKDDCGTETLPKLQYEILCSSAAALKSGGLLIYSTCTLNPAENGHNIRKFLDENKDYEPYPIRLPKGIRRCIDEPENELTLFPQINGTDGFFISVIKRK